MSEKTIFIVNAALVAARPGLDRIPSPVTGTLEEVHLLTDNAPDGGDAIFDVNKNGVSIWNADQTQRVKIEDSQTSGQKTGLGIAVTQFEDFISVDFDEFTDDAVSVGGKLYILLIFSETGGGGGANSGVFLHASTQSLSNNTETKIVLANVDSDDGLYDSGEGTAKVEESAYFMVVGQITYAASAIGRRIARIGVETSDPSNPIAIFENSVDANASGTTTVQVSGIIPPLWTAPDTRIWLLGFQSSGGSLSANGNAGNVYSTWLSVIPAPKV